MEMKCLLESLSKSTLDKLVLSLYRKLMCLDCKVTIKIFSIITRFTPL